MIAAGLLCTVLAVFSISRQLSVVADASRKQQAEEALRTSFPSKAFCARVSLTRRNIDSTAVAAETPGMHTHQASLFWAAPTLLSRSSTSSITDTFRT
jgi:hypothetical protein